MIDENKLIDGLKQSGMIADNEYGNAMIDFINSQPKAREWIPCSERLPEDGTYLCTIDGELCGINEPFTGMCGIENGIWDEPDCIIAWMPPPEPYKEDN